MKCCCLFSAEIILPKLPQKIQKDLVVGCLIHLIDHEDHFFQEVPDKCL